MYGLWIAGWPSGVNVRCQCPASGLRALARGLGRRQRGSSSR